MAQNGTLIDVGGDFRRGMNLQVSLPFALKYDHPISFLSDVGENWNLYVHKLRDGIVVLGVLNEGAPEDTNAPFAANAAAFGATVGEAINTPERKIELEFEWAIINNNGILLWTTGGIPLKAPPPAIPVAPTFAPTRRFNGKTYAEFLQPVVSKKGSEVGLISVFEDITGEQLVLLRSAYFNAVVCVLLWVITVAFSTTYLRRVRPSTISCAQIPCLDEDETVEFKSSLRWDYVLQKPNKELERTVVKTVAGFMNSENGGTLIIGISDAKEILGLQADYATFKDGKPDRDGFELHLRQILIAAVGAGRCARWVKTHFCSLQDKEFCVVSVAPSSDPVFVKDEANVLQMFVRVGNSTRVFGVQEALTYARDRWGGLTLPRWHAHRPIPHPAG
jgi:hypothetical protein